MTNAQIIFWNSVDLCKAGIIGTTGRKIKVTYEKDGEEVTEIIDEPEEIHTFADWKAHGYFVQKGQKAVAKFPIWNYTDKPNKKARERAEAEGKEINPDPHYYMKESCFFTVSQTSAAIKQLPAVIY